MSGTFSTKFKIFKYNIFIFLTIQKNNLKKLIIKEK